MGTAAFPTASTGTGGSNAYIYRSTTRTPRLRRKGGGFTYGNAGAIDTAGCEWNAVHSHTHTHTHTHTSFTHTHTHTHIVPLVRDDCILDEVVGLNSGHCSFVDTSRVLAKRGLVTKTESRAHRTTCTHTGQHRGKGWGGRSMTLCTAAVIVPQQRTCVRRRPREATRTWRSMRRPSARTKDAISPEDSLMFCACQRESSRVLDVI